MNYYKRHIGDYAAATRHLSMLEHGAYTLLLDVYYTSEAPLPAEERAVHRLVGARSRDEREAVSQILNEFFTLQDDGWHQTRCDEEIGKKQAKSEFNREIGKRGGRPKKETQTVNEKNPNGFQSETQTVSENNPSHKPLANNHKKEESLSSPTASRGAGESDPGREGDYLPSATAYGHMAKLLRTHGVDVAPGRPDFREWVDKGLSDEEALAAVQSARQAKPAPEPIPWPYLAKVLTTLRQAAATVPDKPAQTAKSAPVDRWWINDAGIDRKARELGMFARGGETYPAFKDRIFAELRKRGEATPQEQAA